MCPLGRAFVGLYLPSEATWGQIPLDHRALSGGLPGKNTARQTRKLYPTALPRPKQDWEEQPPAPLCWLLPLALTFTTTT